MNRKAISILLCLLFLLPIYSASNGLDEEQLVDGWASESSKNWHVSSPVLSQETEINALNPKIPSPYGEFDPLIQKSPVPKLDFSDSETLSILQLKTNNGELIKGLSEEYGFIPLDRISTNVWMIKKVSSDDSFSKLEHDDKVRWVNNLPIGWKLHPLLNLEDSSNSLTLITVLSPDIDLVNLELLKIKLIESGMELISCDLMDCVVKLGKSPKSDLGTLLTDDRIIWIEPRITYVLTNAQAGEQSGIQPLLNNWNSGLNGSGETVSIVDTGLDMDHSDYASQLIAVQNGFGLDNNPSDSISGHGTHVTGTLLGDGSGESEAFGIAPAATLHMYQLENNQQGVIGRIGSIYNLMQDAYDNSARFQSTSWVSENAGGQYNSDSQSVDRFLWKNRDFTAIYSAGNNGSNGVNTVAAPSTAKNAISVGASTDSLTGSVASFSGQGPTFDGRIKPDLVAPGENICSSRAQEATSSQGVDCTGAFHDDGTTPLHMSLSGASQATPVVSGAAVLTRQYLREELGISSPGSDLIKAILVHGAEDLGTSDVPNPLEGWGRLNLENSLYPVHLGTPLNTWYDNSQSLNPGRMFIYAYELDSSKGIEVTLAWNDEDVSSSSLQTSPKLLNDLDLVVIAPNGTEYYGNDFLNGISISSGTSDNINNLERIRINPTQSSSVGVWQIQIHHRGGNSQPFSLLVTGLGQEEPSSDLSVISGSLTISESTPMVNTPVLINANWVNQANLTTGNYQVTVLDLTTGNIIIPTTTMNSLAGGGIDSVQDTYTFTVTGTHDLQLIIDVDDEVNELNENNNVYNISFIVAAEGVRLEMLNLNGSIDTQREYLLDPFNETSIDLNFRLEHQGTETENVQFSVLSIRAIDETNPLYTLQTTDTWATEINLSSSVISMAPDGSEGSIIEFTLNLENLDADLSSNPKYYASAETIIVEVVSTYINNPLVTDSLKFEVLINPIADLEVVIAGSGTETGVPGDWAKFSQGIRNTGNSPATFELSCITESNWEVRVGRDSISNVYELQRLNQGDDISTEISVRVPSVVGGSPAVGQMEEVYCTVIDVAGTIDGYETLMKIVVGEQATFETILYDSQGQNIEPALSNPSLIVKPSENVELILDIENTGNIILDLNYNLERSETDWSYQLFLSSNDEPMDSTSFSVPIASSISIRIEILVPSNAVMGTYNDIELKIELNPFIYSLNTTRLILEELPKIEVIQYDDPCIVVAGKDTACDITIKNTGNVDLPLIWPTTSENKLDQSEIIVPDGWSAFLSNTPGLIKSSEQKSIKLYLQTSHIIDVDVEDFVTVKTTSELESGQKYISNLQFNVVVKPSTVVDFELVDSVGDLLVDSYFFDLEPGLEKEFLIKVTNIGNYKGELNINFDVKNNWKITCSSVTNSLDAGAEILIPCILSVPEDGGSLTELVLIGTLDNDLENSTIEVGELVLRVSSQEVEITNNSVLGMPIEGQLVIVIVVFCLILLVGSRLRKVSDFDDGEDIIESSEFRSNSRDRLELLMNAGDNEDNVISGGVDKNEIEAALNQSKPSLPSLPGLPEVPVPNATKLPEMPTLPKPPSAKAFGPPPIPPEGIPPGWTMEQWIHYGHEWLNKKRKI